MEKIPSDSLLPDKERAQLDAIFSQPFYFLARGGQSYAFISQDQTVILKFFKNHHIRFWNFLKQIPLPSAFENFRQQILKKKFHQSPAFFESCKISYFEFRQRTGLIYLHLHKTDCFKRKLTLIDNLGIVHQIDIDSTPFALQKKAEFTSPKLKALIQGKGLATAKLCVDSLLSLIVERCQKGIADRDPNFRRNIGFIDNQAVEIDLGSYSKDESLKNPENLERELVDKTRKLRHWLYEKNPELSLYLSEQINKILEENIR